MKIALCYESVVPARGGCETYIADLARRLDADGHTVHLFACEWDESRLPATTVFHPLPRPTGPRFLRPWRFARACERALAGAGPLVSVGFNKTWGQDVQYPQGGLHVAAVEHGLRKHPSPLVRRLAGWVRHLEPANVSFRRLERRQYQEHRPLVVVNSRMVAGHFRHHYGVPEEQLRIVHSSIDPSRFTHPDRPRRRQEHRDEWGLRPDDVVGLFVGLNYRLKGLGPLLHAVRLVDPERFRLLVVGSPRLAGYQRLARRLGIAAQVRFLGQRSDVHHCYFAADFLIHPTFYDPCSLVALEALTCGLPVITSRFNGAAELLEPLGEGHVVADPHDHASLAWCITRLLDGPRRAAAVQVARRRGGCWTFEQHYRQMVEVFEEAALRKQVA
jgi:UDP-glucose:(heptosyl)LPS alpha-1,3-glucosyltransferase